MQSNEAEDWRISLAVARLAVTTGMVPVRSGTLVAVEKDRLDMKRRLTVSTRQWDDWKRYALELHERLQKYEPSTSVMLLNSETPPASAATVQRAAETAARREVVKAYVRKLFVYEGVDDAMSLVTIEEIEEAGDKGERPGDFWARDEQVGQILRVVDGVVSVVWSNS